MSTSRAISSRESFRMRAGLDTAEPGSTRRQAFFNQSTDLLKHAFNLPLWEAQRLEPFYVTEVLAAILQKHYGSIKTQAPLEETDLVNDILPGPDTAVGLLILGRQDKKGEVAAVKHLL